MGQGPRICLVGAGGMSFGPAMVNDAIKTTSMQGATLALHDIDPDRLAVARRLAHRLNDANGRPITIEASTEPAEAMAGADFTLASAEVGRWSRWRQDYEIPNRWGATHITGENGGPGAVFHSLRSIRTTLGICADLERHCPDTFLINLTNPMSRVTLAINSATRLRNVGMCHEFDGGVSRLAAFLRMPKRNIAATASGINHFTFFTDIRNAETGEDLYPRVRALWAKPIFDYSPRTTRVAQRLARVPLVDMVVDQFFTPLVAHMVRTYGLMPASIDSHIGEYVPFAKQITHWHPTPVDLHEAFMRRFEGVVTRYGEGRSRLPLHKVGRSPEEPFPIISAMWTGRERSINAVNVPNRGYVPNLPEGAIVEVPATATSDGLVPEVVAPIERRLAEFMTTQIEIQDLVVQAALTGDPRPAFEALRMDPLSPPDVADCRAMFDELFAAQRDVLGLSGQLDAVVS